MQAHNSGIMAKGPSGLHYHHAGDGPALVMLHGSGPGVTGWLNFGGILPEFAEHFSTYIPDQPGFGGSPAPEMDRPYGDISTAAVIALMDELGLERVHLLGNSMGGATACRIALQYPDRVERLALMGPGGISVGATGPRPTEGFKRMIEFSNEPSRDRMIAWLRTMVADQTLVTEELINARLTAAQAPGAIEWFRTFLAPHAQRSGMERRRDAVPLWAQSSKITQKTLITWGRDDRVVPLEGGLLPLQQIPNVELHVFAPCGHWPMVECRTEFIRVVTEFLTR